MNDMRSIKYFLLFSLLLSIMIASTVNGISNYYLTEQVLQPFLDNQLIRISTLIDILRHFVKSNQAARKEIIDYLNHIRSGFQEKFIFQIRDKQDNVLISSGSHTSWRSEMYTALQNIPLGFSNQLIHHDRWRVYAMLDQRGQTKIIVAELHHLRHSLANQIVHNNTNILLIISPIFGLVVWMIISSALRPITRITNEISNRAPDHLESVQLIDIPSEIKPLILELNKLFTRLKKAFTHNERFAANAAHELRTPLAALKAYAQLALQSPNLEECNKALHKLIAGVDRSARIITQLLTLSRLREEKTTAEFKPVDLHKLAVNLIAELVPNALEKKIDITLTAPPSTMIIIGNETALGILIRNIVDNAIRYTPPHGEVTVSILDEEKQLVFQVIDTGPGIPVPLRQEVFERFYRILGNQASGSGLGLAIVEQIAALHHAEVSLNTPLAHGGLQFRVAFPKHPA